MKRARARQERAERELLPFTVDALQNVPDEQAPERTIHRVGDVLDRALAARDRRRGLALRRGVSRVVDVERRRRAALAR